MKPVTTLEELDALDSDLMVRGYLRGYLHGFKSTPDYTQRDRAYWHGYLNGQTFSLSNFPMLRARITQPAGQRHDAGVEPPADRVLTRNRDGGVRPTKHEVVHRRDARPYKRQ